MFSIRTQLQHNCDLQVCYHRSFCKENYFQSFLHQRIIFIQKPNIWGISLENYMYYIKPLVTITDYNFRRYCNRAVKPKILYFNLTQIYILASHNCNLQATYTSHILFIFDMDTYLGIAEICKNDWDKKNKLPILFRVSWLKSQ